MAKPPTRYRGPTHGQSSQQVLVQQTRSVAHTGPLPSPDVLADYERLHPGTAATIVAMAEREQAHRHAREEASQVADIAHRETVANLHQQGARDTHLGDLVGQVTGFLIAAGCVGAAIFAIFIRADAWTVAACLSLPVVGIVQALRSAKESRPPKTESTKG